MGLIEAGAAAGKSAGDAVAGLIDDVHEFSFGPANVKLGLAKAIEATGALRDTGSDLATIRELRTPEGALKYLAAALAYKRDNVLALAGTTDRIDHLAAVYNVKESDYLEGQ